MIEYLLQLDRLLFIFLNGLGGPMFDVFWLTITNKILNAVIYFGLALYFFKKTNLKHFSILLVSVSLLILFTDQFTNFIKYTVSRPRPCHVEDLNGLIRLVKQDCGGAFGYFSGHASNSFALAIFFSRLMSKIKWLPNLLIVYAFLVAYSRIYIGVHYPLDVFSGLIMGCFSGYFGYYLYNRLIYIKSQYEFSN